MEKNNPVNELENGIIEINEELYQDDPELMSIIEFLHKGTFDEELIRDIKAEEEYYESIEEIENQKRQAQKENASSLSLAEQKRNEKE
jgi:hypothetical protein